MLKFGNKETTFLNTKFIIFANKSSLFALIKVIKKKITILTIKAITFNCKYYMPISKYSIRFQQRYSLSLYKDKSLKHMALQKTCRWFGENDSVKLSDLRQIGIEGVVTSFSHFKPS